MVTHAKYLSREEEQHLILCWQKRRDDKALLGLISSHYKFIVSIAAGYSRSYKKCLLEDLVSAGTIGFIEGLERYKLQYGYRLSTQVRWWIRARILVFVRHNGFQVRVPDNQHVRRCFFGLGDIKERMGIKYIQNNEEALLAKKMLGVPLRPETIIAIDRLRHMVPGSRFNADESSDGDKLLQTIPDGRKTPEEEFGDREEEDFFRRVVGEAIHILKNKREKEIFTSRRLTDPPVKLKMLAERYGISRERVRQIEKKAFEKIKKAVLLQRKKIAV